MVWPVQTHPAQSTGPESKRNSGDGEYFSLDFSFYRTALPSKWIPLDQPAALFRKPHFVHHCAARLIYSQVGRTRMVLRCGWQCPRAHDSIVIGE